MKTPRPVDREIARLREIVGQTSQALLLSDGPVNPDAGLLDLCAEALHLLRQAGKIDAEHRVLFTDGESWDWSGLRSDELTG